MALMIFKYLSQNDFVLTKEYLLKQQKIINFQKNTKEKKKKQQVITLEWDTSVCAQDFPVAQRKDSEKLPMAGTKSSLLGRREEVQD